MPRIPANQRREEFIRAAVKVVAAEGVKGATTRRIAAEANAPLAALHYCFSSKEQLFYAVFEKQVQILQQEFWQPRRNAGLGRTAANLLRRLMDWYQSDLDFTRAQVDLYYWALRQDVELAKKAYDIHLAALADCLRTGMRSDDDGELVEPLARFIAGISDGLVNQFFGHLDEKRTLSDIDIAAEAIENLAAAHQGLRAEKA